MLGHYTTVFPRCKAKNAVFSGNFLCFYPGYYILGACRGEDTKCKRGASGRRPLQTHLWFLRRGRRPRRPIPIYIFGFGPPLIRHSGCYRDFPHGLSPASSQAAYPSPAACGRVHSLRCSSFPICTHCVGLQMGPTLAQRPVLLVFLTFCHSQFITPVVIRVLRMAFYPM